MTTALSLSTKVAKNIKPQPTKLEIVEALAIRHHQQLTERAARDQVAFDAAENQLITGALEVAAKREVIEANKATIYYTGALNSRVRSISVYRPNYDVQENEFTAVMRAATKTIKGIKESGSLRVPDFKDIRRQIRDRMNGTLSNPTDRVSALLADPSTVKALDKTLAELECDAPTVST